MINRPFLTALNRKYRAVVKAEKAESSCHRLVNGVVLFFTICPLSHLQHFPQLALPSLRDGESYRSFNRRLGKAKFELLTNARAEAPKQTTTNVKRKELWFPHNPSHHSQSATDKPKNLQKIHDPTNSTSHIP